MSEVTAGPFEVSEPMELDIGGLRFSSSFRAPAGATLRVSTQFQGGWRELLRFDDFVEQPHFHVPASGDATMVDRQEEGAALDFFIALIRDQLGELLMRGGFSEVRETIDLDTVTNNVDRIRQAMIDVVPDGYTRVPGVGLQRAIPT
jgi:hypothetical protein